VSIPSRDVDETRTPTAVSAHASPRTGQICELINPRVTRYPRNALRHRRRNRRTRIPPELVGIGGATGPMRLPSSNSGAVVRRGPAAATVDRHGLAGERLLATTRSGAGSASDGALAISSAVATRHCRFIRSTPLQFLRSHWADGPSGRQLRQSRNEAPGT
jgi:hypothetical protein